MEIIAHRGASFEAPENTLAAARLAWAQGADAVECDVHLSADGQLVVIHDPDALRTTGEPLVVRETPLRRLQECDAGTWKDPRFAGERIPTLDAWLAEIPPGRRGFIEIKCGVEVLPALQAALDRRPRNIGVVLISFHLDVIRAIKRAMPNLEACWLLEHAAVQGRATASDLLRVAQKASLDGFDLEAVWPIQDALVQQIRAERLKWYVWTVNEPAQARELIAAGVDGITTDRPGWLRAQLP